MSRLRRALWLLLDAAPLIGLAVLFAAMLYAIFDHLTGAR